MMLPDPLGHILSSPLPNRPARFINTNTPLSLPPIRELLNCGNGQQAQQRPPQSPRYSYGAPQHFQKITHSNYTQLALEKISVSPLSMEVTAPRSQNSSPISCVNNAAAPTFQRPHSIVNQLHIEQQRQESLELDAHMAIQRANDSDTIPKDAKSRRKKRQTLPRHTKLILLSWLSENLDRPYPNSREKYELLLKTGITIQKLDYWFINARRRKIGILRKLKENGQGVVLSL